MSEKHQASDGHSAKREASENVKGESLRVAIKGIHYRIKDALTAMMTSGFDVGKPYEVSHMAVIMQTMNERTVLTKSESVHFEISFRQRKYDIVTSRQYLAKVSKALLHTN